MTIEFRHCKDCRHIVVKNNPVVVYGCSNKKPITSTQRSIYDGSIVGLEYTNSNGVRQTTNNDFLPINEINWNGRCSLFEKKLSLFQKIKRLLVHLAKSTSGKALVCKTRWNL